MSSPFIEGINPNLNYTLSLINRLNIKENSNNDTLSALLSTTTSTANSLSSSSSNLIYNSSSNLDIWSLPYEINPLVNIVSRNYININVKDYGAIGDGVINDTTAINNAISALPANNGILYFPNGTYLISSTLSINNKSNLLIKSDNAEIKKNNDTNSLFYFDNCPFLKFCEGRMTLTTDLASFGSILVALEINTSLNTLIENVVIIGKFLEGIHFRSISSSSSIIRNVVVRSCNKGIYLNNIDEVAVVGISISNCDVGIKMYNSSFNMVNCAFNTNRIACFVDGDLSTTRGSSICSGSFNHNNTIGVLIKNVVNKGLLFSGNQVWANFPNLPTSTDISNATARNYSYGVYIENCKNINFCNNIIARNPSINIGLDGYMNCLFNGNSINTDLTTTIYNFKEFGETGVGENSYNMFINNMYFGGLTPNTNMDIDYFNSQNGVCNLVKYACGTSSGIGYTQQYLITANTGTHYLFGRQFYTIRSDVIKVASTSTTPNDQTASIYITSRSIGTEFAITLNGNTANSAEIVWIRLNHTTGTINIDIALNISSYVSYDSVNKALKLNCNNDGIRFQPRSNTNWDWYITKL